MYQYGQIHCLSCYYIERGTSKKMETDLYLQNIIEKLKFTTEIREQYKSNKLLTGDIVNKSAFAFVISFQRNTRGYAIKFQSERQPLTAICLQNKLFLIGILRV